MPKVTFDFRKTKPATGGGRQDYIKPGKYKFKVVNYDPKPSKAGKAMHTYTSEVMTGPEAGKKIVDRFPMPRPGENMFPMEKLLAFFEACGAKATGKRVEVDPAAFKSKMFVAEVGDVTQPARTENGTSYPARLSSDINKYIIPGVNDDEDDEDVDDEDDDDEEDEDEDEEEDEEDDEDDEDEDDEEEDEDEEDEEPAPKTAKKSTKSTAKKPAAKAGKKAKSDDEDFPFD